VEHRGMLATRKQVIIGEPFNPRYEACGFHPEEIVSRRHDLTDGQKWLYERLVRWARSIDGVRANERAGEVWRSHENIAAELGKSERQVRRDLKRLESLGLLKPRIRDGRKSNTYVFLFHVWFERTMTSGQILSDERGLRRSSVSAQKHACEPECPLATGRPRPPEAGLNGHPRPANQEVPNQQEKPSSSSSRHNGRLREQRARSEPEKMMKKSLLSQHQTSASALLWTSQELDDATRILTKFTTTGDYFFLGCIDITTVVAIMSYMESVDDLRLWLASSNRILGSAHTWGRFVADAKHWPSCRAVARQRAEAVSASLPTCSHGLRPADQCETCAQEREKLRKAEKAAAEAARVPKPPTAEEIASRAHRKRNQERQEKLNERWMAFYDAQPSNVRLKLNRMTLDAMKGGTSLLGESLEEREQILDSLERGTHPLFRPASVVTAPVVEEW